jgi:hypothetical protein
LFDQEQDCGSNQKQASQEKDASPGQRRHQEAADSNPNTAPKQTEHLRTEAPPDSLVG